MNFSQRSRRTPLVQKAHDERVGVGSNCKLWFPCDELSGTTVTDSLNGAVVTDASAAFTELNAVSFGQSAAAPSSGSIAVKLKPNFLLVTCQKIVTSEAFVSLKIGSTIFAQVTSGIASCDYGLGAGNNAITASTAIGSVNGDILTAAAAVIGDTIYHYDSINQAGIAVNASADASGFTAAFSDGNPTLDNNATIHSIAIRQHVYGMALFTFDKDEFTTTEIVAALNEIDNNWPNGRKTLPSSLL